MSWTFDLISIWTKYSSRHYLLYQNFYIIEWYLSVKKKSKKKIKNSVFMMVLIDHVKKTYAIIYHPPIAFQLVYNVRHLVSLNFYFLSARKSKVSKIFELAPTKNLRVFFREKNFDKTSNCTKNDRWLVYLLVMKSKF